MVRLVHAVASLGIITTLYAIHRYATQPWYPNRIGGLAPVLNGDSPSCIPQEYSIILMQNHNLIEHIAALREAHVDISASIRPGLNLIEGSQWYTASLNDTALLVVRERDDVAWLECDIKFPHPKLEFAEPNGSPPPLPTLPEGTFRVVAQKTRETLGDGAGL